MTDTKDSNPKQAFGDAKVPVGLVPDTAIIEMALALLEGALKYGGYNYRVVGVKASTYNHAMERHRKKWWNGQDRDPATKVRELASVMACCAILIDAEICGMLTDDRPPVAPIGPQLDENMALVAHLKELFKDHNPHQYTWEDSPGLQQCQDEGCPHYGTPHAHVTEVLGAGPLEPEGFPDGYSSEPGPQCHEPGCTDEATDERRAYCGKHALVPGALTPMTPPPPFAVPIQDTGPLMLPCGCAKRCKGHPVSLDAAKVDVPDSPGNYAAERAAGPKDPSGRPYSTVTADAEFPQPPPDYRIPASPREFDPAD